MLRGMDNSTGNNGEDGDTAVSNARSSVSVNCSSDIKTIQNRKISRDTDTESFTYEHFPVVCPTCRGAGQVHEDDLNELVSFVPVKDERLRPSRIFCKMLIMLFVCLCIAAPVAFFLIPRSVSITLTYEKSSKISIPENKNLTSFIIVQSQLIVKNDNYLSVKLTNINVQVSWSKIILNSGTCIQNITVTVPSRTSLKRSMETKVIFDGNKRGTAGFLFRKNCADGYRNHIFVKFATTAKVDFLTQGSQISNTNYPYIQCYNFSGYSENYWMPRNRRSPVKLLP